MSPARVCRPVLALVAVLALGGALSACGSDEAETRTSSDNEGVPLKIGNLTYQVQVSRQLNPSDVEDQSYMIDLAPGTAPPLPDETWFAVFMRAWNQTDKAQLVARDFYITDTVDNRFDPVGFGPANVFAYRPLNITPSKSMAPALRARAIKLAAAGPTMVPPNETLPLTDSSAYSAPSSGALVLFKLSLNSLDDRPLMLHVRDPSNPKKEVEFTLDV